MDELMDGWIDGLIGSCDGNTAAHYACLQNNEEIVGLLLDAGCHWNIRNRNNQTPLDCTTSSVIQHLIITE